MYVCIRVPYLSLTIITHAFATNNVILNFVHCGHTVSVTCWLAVVQQRYVYGHGMSEDMVSCEKEGEYSECSKEEK